ncbi:MAG: hypothetical protein ABFE01_21185 [Phycisphaerales bacterium]
MMEDGQVLSGIATSCGATSCEGEPSWHGGAETDQASASARVEADAEPRQTKR